MTRHSSQPPASREVREYELVAAQDAQAMDLANRGHSELEQWAGGPMRPCPPGHLDRGLPAETEQFGGGSVLVARYPDDGPVRSECQNCGAGLIIGGRAATQSPFTPEQIARTLAAVDEFIELHAGCEPAVEEGWKS